MGMWHESYTFSNSLYLCPLHGKTFDHFLLTAYEEAILLSGFPLTTQLLLTVRLNTTLFAYRVALIASLLIYCLAYTSLSLIHYILMDFDAMQTKCSVGSVPQSEWYFLLQYPNASSAAAKLRILPSVLVNASLTMPNNVGIIIFHQSPKIVPSQKTEYRNCLANIVKKCQMSN